MLGKTLVTAACGNVSAEEEVTYTTDSTFGTLVGTFTTPWLSSTLTSTTYTEGSPSNSNSDIILSDSNFQSVRSAATGNKVFYVWYINGTQYYCSYYRSAIENARCGAAPTTTINPYYFYVGGSNNTTCHFWDENSAPTCTGTGTDYSFAEFRDMGGGNYLTAMYQFSTIKAQDYNISFYYYVGGVSKFQIWYK